MKLDIRPRSVPFNLQITIYSRNDLRRRRIQRACGRKHDRSEVRVRKRNRESAVSIPANLKLTEFIESIDNNLAPSVKWL